MSASLFLVALAMVYIKRCWMHSRAQPVPLKLHVRSPSRVSVHGHQRSLGHTRNLSSTSNRSSRSRRASDARSKHDSRGSIALTHSREPSGTQPARTAPPQPLQIETSALEPVATDAPTGPSFSPAVKPASFWDLRIFGGEGTAPTSASQSNLSPLSPRRRKALARAKLGKRITRFVTSPFPYVVLILLGIMVVMIFVDVMPISGLICVFAITMVVVVVLGNHFRNKQIWIEEEEEEDLEEVYQPMGQQELARLQLTGGAAASASQLEAGEPLTRQKAAADEEAALGPLTYEDRLDNLNQFFEALFGSIDYSLLIIFLGLFIVVENMASTGIPERVWGRIVGKAPFASAASIAGISVFVLITSQFLGNVAVIQLAKPNVEDLDDNTKRLAWAIISFVATVGGNLTITGSAGKTVSSLYRLK